MDLEKNVKSSVSSVCTEDNGMLYFESYDELFAHKIIEHTFCRVPIQNFSNSDGKVKTLLCHDMQGGYLCYDKLNGAALSCEQALYTFFHWWYIDIFVYFSHKFISVPPIVWTNQAHRHGVVVLGTLITEGKEGYELFKKTFSSIENVDILIEKLVDLCLEYNFDGWLINIENPVEEDRLENLAYFLKSLRLKLRNTIGQHSYVVWYDSIITTGKIKYQNELNENNKKWFDLVDGIYLNYNWKPENLKNSLVNAEERSCEVFVGVDVFGRGCIGDGGWNSCEALQHISEHQLSSAIFAPGWISEKFPDMCIFENSFRFWNSVRGLVKSNRKVLDVFSTNFYVGHELQSDWFCMDKAQLQPFYLESSLNNGVYVDSHGLWINSDNEVTLFLCDINLNNSLQVLVKTSTPAIVNLYLNDERIITLKTLENFNISKCEIPSGKNLVLRMISIKKIDNLPLQLSFLSIA